MTAFHSTLKRARLHPLRLRVFISDLNIDATRSFVASLNENGEVAKCAEVSVDDWQQQVAGFQEAIAAFGRIDYVFPIAGIGERGWIKKGASADHSTFSEPDLRTLDVDLKGFLYTVSLAVQQFRRQEVDEFGFRGKSACHIFRRNSSISLMEFSDICPL